MNSMKSTFSNIEKYLVVIPILILLIIKIPHLAIPYFWDEAWSYFPAVFKMYETGPGLLPGALPLWDAKGHPLFFFFLSSVWMKIGGTSVVWVHILPLLISAGTILTVYALLKKQVNIWAANSTALLLSVQSLFLAQASMLLPEMLVALLLVLSIHLYLQKKYWQYVIIASIMVLTKETTIIFVGGFIIFHLFMYLNPEKRSRAYILESITLLIPTFIYAIFLILHKKEFGTFFFSDHTGYIEFNSSAIFYKLKVAIANIFLRYGRNAILFSTVVAVLLLLLFKIKLKYLKLVALIALQLTLFLLFSSFNFYTQRYMLSLMILFIAVAGTIFSQIKINKIAAYVAVAAISLVPAYYSFTKKTNSDNDLGYVKTVKVFKQMVRYCEEQGWQDKPISASFNMIFALQNPHLGYASTSDGFSNISDLKDFRNTEIFINECTAWDYRQQLDTIKMENTMRKYFEEGQAWGEIFVKTP